MDNSVNDIKFLENRNDIVEEIHNSDNEIKNYNEDNVEDMTSEIENLNSSEFSKTEVSQADFNSSVPESSEKLNSPQIKDSLDYPQRELITGCNLLERCNNMPKYIVRFKLYGTNYCCGYLPNQLRLDNVTDNYYYVPYTATLDGYYFNPGLNILGNSINICAYRRDKIIEFGLNAKPSILEEITDLNDNLQGFLISQIMNYIDNCLHYVPYANKANLNIFQKMCLFKACGKKYILFNFNIVNNGMGLAQNILFSDLFPKNVLIERKSIFLEGMLLGENKISINNYNKVIIELGNLNKGENKNLTIVAEIGDVCNKINYATISYISDVFKWPLQSESVPIVSGSEQSASQSIESTVVDIEQKISNPCCIYNINRINNCCSYRCCCR